MFHIKYTSLYEIDNIMYLENTAFSVPYLCDGKKNFWDPFWAEKNWEGCEYGECCSPGLFGVDVLGCGIKYREVVTQSSLYKIFQADVCVMPTQGKFYDTLFHVFTINQRLIDWVTVVTQLLYSIIKISIHSDGWEICLNTSEVKAYAI